MRQLNEIEEMKKEVKRLVGELREKGVPDKELYALFVRKVKLSRLLITSDYRIILLDYKGVEIQLPPLPKAVYLLFLNHPEGITYKDLPDYTDELREIYCRMKQRTQVPKKVEKSITDVTDPLNHSINEKCARIRQAFCKRLGAAIARRYYIVGKRSEPKKILLDRELVTWGKKAHHVEL